MDMLDAIRANLLSPAVLFFVLGVVAALVKSDLKFPEALYVTLTIYLLTAIGFKGGVAISEAGLGVVWVPALAAMAPMQADFPVLMVLVMVVRLPGVQMHVPARV